MIHIKKKKKNLKEILLHLGGQLTRPLGGPQVCHVGSPTFPHPGGTPCGIQVSLHHFSKPSELH